MDKGLKIIKQPRMTIQELIDQVTMYSKMYKELGNSTILGVKMVDDKSDIYDGAIVFDIYSPDIDEGGVLTVPVEKTFNAN